MADEPTPAPVRPGNAGRNDYPRMLYQPDGRTMVCETPEEHDAIFECPSSTGTGGVRSDLSSTGAMT